MSDYKVWYSANLTGWKGVLMGIFMLWCLGSGLYTLALIVRRFVTDL